MGGYVYTKDEMEIKLLEISNLKLTIENLQLRLRTAQYDADYAYKYARKHLQETKDDRAIMRDIIFRNESNMLEQLAGFLNIRGSKYKTDLEEVEKRRA